MSTPCSNSGPRREHLPARTTTQGEMWPRSGSTSSRRARGREQVLLDFLKQQGEFVRSASSTIEPPVVRKIRETLPPHPEVCGRAFQPHRCGPRAEPSGCPDVRDARQARCVGPAPGAPPREPRCRSGPRPTVARPGPVGGPAPAPPTRSPPVLRRPDCAQRAGEARCRRAERSRDRPVPSAPAAPRLRRVRRHGAGRTAPGAPRPARGRQQPFSTNQGIGVARCAAPGQQPFAPSQGMPRPQSRAGSPAPRVRVRSGRGRSSAGPASGRCARTRHDAGRAAVPRPGPARAVLVRPVQVVRCRWRRWRLCRSSWRWRRWRFRWRRCRWPSRWRWPRWPWRHPGRLRAWWRSPGSGPQVQACQAPRVRADAGPDDRWRAKSARRRLDRHPAGRAHP